MRTPVGDAIPVASEPPRERLARAVKAYDIRGVVGVDLDVPTYWAIGRALAEQIAPAGGPLLVGRDMRLSSPALTAALISGARSTGGDVLDLGLASTDLVTYASGELQAASVMVTASHNPAAHNGCKVTGPGAQPVARVSGLAAVRDRAVELLETGAVPHLPATRGAAHPGRVRPLDLTGRFAAHVRTFAPASTSRSLHVVVDAGNGMAGLLWPAVAAGLPVATTPLFMALDGSFPNHPANPLDPANLAALGSRVPEVGADLGLAFDGDADRVFAVDERGRPLDASVIGAIIAERALVRAPGAVVLHNVICSRVVPETIRAAGGLPVRTPVGHSLIKAEMARTNAVMGVEHSGHYYIRENHRADSGLIAAMLLLDALAATDGPLSALVAPFARTVTSGEVSIEVPDHEAAIEAVAEQVGPQATLDRLDGLTATYPDGSWWNIRASNTESVVRVNVEADDVDTMQALLDEVLATVAASATTRNP